MPITIESEEKIEEQEKKDELVQQIGKTLTKRAYLTKESLLPSAKEWLERWKRHKKRRLQFLMCVGGVLSFLLFLDSLVFLMNLLHMKKMEIWTFDHTLPFKPSDNNRAHFTSDCVAIFPSKTGIEDWYSLYNIPYAALPRRTGIFARPIFTITFLECYHAFWIGVRPENRQFRNGQLRFVSSKKEVDESCLQMDPLKRRGNESGMVGSCLTLSFNFQLSRSRGLTGVPKFLKTRAKPLQPVLAYIGGHAMLYHRPRLISPLMSARLGVLYVTIRYRLGIFGFADFQMPDFGPNHAVEDVRKALGWLHDNSEVFGGRADDLILFAENSGATIGAILMNSRYQSSEKTNTTQPYLISRAWIADGAVVIPKTLSTENAFHHLLRTDVDLMAACRKGRQYRMKDAGSGSAAIGSKALCLEGTVGEQEWLAKTPPSWSFAQDNYLTKMPEVGETRVSLINEDDSFSFVQGPLDSSSLRNMPMVIYTSLDQLYSFKRLYNLSTIHNTSLSLAGFRKLVKSSFATFASSSVQTNYAVQMLKAYEPMADTYIKEHRDLEDVYTALVSDLRGVCPSNAYAERLLQASSGNSSAVYRILHRGIPVVLQDAKNYVCDIPFFLNHENETGCQDLNTIPDNELLFEAFHDFIHTKGQKAGSLQPMVIGADLPVEISFNILVVGPLGLQMSTAGSREVASLSACNEWKQTNNERNLGLISSYARVN